KILGRRRTTGETTARSQRHGPLPRLAPFTDILRARVESVSAMTIAGLRLWLLAAHHAGGCNGCVWDQQGRPGLTLKKRRTGLPSKTGRMLRTRASSGAAISPR